MGNRCLAPTFVAAALLLLAAPLALAQEDSVPIYGEELMSAQEQEEFRARNRALRTEEERRVLQEQHRKEMRTRARERGVDAPIFGQRLMNREERAQHRARMRELRTGEERARFRAEHRQRMLARSREQRQQTPDVAAPGDDSRQVRGRELMTEEERRRHRQEMRSKTTEEERERARREHHEEMKERARERGVELPDDPMPRRGGGGRNK